VQALGLVHLRLRDDFVLEHHGRLDHEELLLAFGGALVAVRGAALGADVLDDCGLLLAVGVAVVVEVEAGPAFGDDEAGPEGVAAGEGVVAFVAAAAVGRRDDDERHWQEGGAPAHVVADLAVDLPVALEQLQHQRLLLPLLLQLLVHVVLQELLPVQLQQRVELQQLVGRLLLARPALRLLPLQLQLQIAWFFFVLLVVRPLPALGGGFDGLFERMLFLVLLRADLLDFQLKLHPANGYFFALVPFLLGVRVVVAGVVGV
jgi:hypothetical protein